MEYIAEVTNGFFGLGIEFWQLIVLLLVAILGIVTIRISFKFDINKHREAKQNSYSAKLMNACTHVSIVTNENNEVGAQSTYISPPGTIQWQCQRCGHVKYPQGDEFERKVKYYLADIDQYNKETKAFKKLLKKAGMTK